MKALNLPEKSYQELTKNDYRKIDLLLDNPFIKVHNFFFFLFFSLPLSSLT